jgi:site-specific recombinase XerD
MRRGMRRTNCATREAANLIAQGQRVEVVQRVLGHRDIRSTLGCAELQETQVRVALDRRALRSARERGQ